MDTKNLGLKVVPWFSTEEWDYVCKLVYSDDIEEQTKGYEQLLVWKSRVQTLPTSVTCTLELLHVRLQDKFMWPKIITGEIPPYAEQELRLSYSTVVMRFLNHLASLFQNTKNQTLYNVAKKLHIPVWVVNIRHSAAHDGSLPSIDVLRLAAGYAFSWLHEYWWKPEALSLSDWKVTEDNIYDDTSYVELCNLLNLWQALNLYQETDYKTVDQIHDKEVGIHVSSLCSKMNSNYSSHNEPTLDSDIEVTADYNCTRGMSIRAASALVLLNIKKFVELVPVYEWDQILFNNLVGEGMFNPSLLSEEDWSLLEDNKLPCRTLKMWKPVLACLPIAVLLHLMQKLLTLTCSINGVVSIQNRLVALWIRELALAVVKLHRVLDIVEEWNASANSETKPTKMVRLAKNVCVNLTQDDELTKLSPKLLYKKLVTRVETECPELKDVLVLGVKTLPDKKEIFEVVKFAVLNPSQLSPIFLPSVLKLVSFPTPVDAPNVMSLVELYIQLVTADVDVDIDAPLLTVSNLTSSSTMSETSAAEKCDTVSKDSGIEDMEVKGTCHNDHEQVKSFNEQNVSKSHWRHAKEHTEWSTSPIGILPWQQDQIWADLTVPKYTWQLSEEMEAVSNITKLPQLFHKSIEWEDVKRRRIKKDGNPKLSRKIVQTALETIVNNSVGMHCTTTEMSH